MASSIDDEDISSVLSAGTNSSLPEIQGVSSVLSRTDTNSSLPSRLQTASIDSEEPDAYIGINWGHLSGYQIPHHTGHSKRSWIWYYGYAIEETKSGKQYWLCRLCHQEKSTKNHQWLIKSSTSKCMVHLESVHNIIKDGIKEDKPQVFEALENNSPEDQAIINHLITSFKPQRFKTALTRWICYDSIKLRQVNIKPFLFII